MTNERQRRDPERRDDPIDVRPTPASADADARVSLFHDDELRAAVEQADALVDTMMKRLTDVFTTERTTLEGQWGRGDNVSTEDLRIALKRYRSFFERLLSV